MSDWTPEQIALLLKHYPDKQASELAILIGRDKNSIYRKAYKLKLKKSVQFLASSASGRILKSPIGAEFIDSKGYTVRKINNDPALSNWKPVHIIEWEVAYGKIPDGRLVSFKDGNKQNTHINNLELITRKDSLEKNTIHRYPREVIDLIRLHKKLERTIEGMKDEG